MRWRRCVGPGISYCGHGDNRARSVRAFLRLATSEKRREEEEPHLSQSRENATRSTRMRPRLRRRLWLSTTYDHVDVNANRDSP